MAETRVDLKHLLEDIRDSYPCPVEEAILTELIANALDSGCSRIAVRLEPEQHRLTFVDNGEGMSPKQFEQYHDIASTTKMRGKGIGFAGIGAKLALLVCREVLTETKRGHGPLASRWWLETSFRAPWEKTTGLGLLPWDKGTAVRLHFRDKGASNLLSPDYVKQAVRSHFYPLLDAEVSRVLRHVYPSGVHIEVNGEEVRLPLFERAAGEYFTVRVGKHRKLTGVGFLAKTTSELSEDDRGLAVSTFGKVIKRGWEWLGVMPQNPSHLTGVVEIPDLVECLTTNKCDFLRDPKTLQKYYKYRKAIQDALGEVLEKLGETRAAEPKPDKSMEKLQKEIDKVVGEVLPNFPELAPLFGRKKGGEPEKGFLPESAGEVTVSLAEGTDATTGDRGGPTEGGGLEGAVAGLLDGAHPEPVEGGEDRADEHKVRRKRPGLMVSFDDATGGSDLAWLRGDTLFINALHPAFKRVQGGAGADLYITFVVASTLSALVTKDRPPLDFLRHFMGVWGGLE